MAKIIQLSTVYNDYYSPLFAHPRYEVWKHVVGYEGYYQVSNHCRIKRNGKILKPAVTKRAGQTVIHLCVKGVTFCTCDYRIMAVAFIPNPENKPTVNHIDGKRQNRALSNLEWATYSEQILHAVSIGIMDSAKNLPNTKIPLLVRYPNGDIEFYESQNDCSRKTGMPLPCISKNFKKRRAYRGLVFEPANLAEYTEFNSLKK